jgi:AcrR family transcriptional regulator
MFVTNYGRHERRSSRTVFVRLGYTPGVDTVAPRSRRARPAKAPLSRAAVVAAGLGILAAEGLGAVTMRRVAEALDTGPASLYVYVANAQELHRQLMDAVIAEVPLPEPDPARWREQLVELLVASVETLDRYPGIARVAIADIPTGENGVGIVDALLGLLRAGGVPDASAAWGADVLSLYVTGVALERSVYAARGWTEEETDEYHEAVHRAFAAVPADRYPNVAALVPFLTTGGAEDRFRFGVDLLVNGLLHTPPPAPA